MTLQTEILPGIRVAALPAEEAAAFEPAWRTLSETALEPNVFYSPAVALAAARHLPEAAALRFLFIVDQRNGAPVLIGCFPLLPTRRRLSLGLLPGFLHAQTALGAPLIDQERADIAIDAFLRWAAQENRSAAGLLLPMVPVDGPLYQAFVRHCGTALAALDLHRRAHLTKAGSRDAALGPDAKKLKELHRLRRRLGEKGALTHESAQEPEAVRRGIEDFLALEASGWKGRKGTSLLQESGRAGFARALSRALADGQNIRIESLRLDGRAVAIGLVLRAGKQGYFWKIAFDESLAAYSPGALLTLALRETLADTDALDAIDSCALPNHPMIDGLWRERLAIADLVVPLPGVSPWRFRLALRIERLRRAARAGLKSAWLRLKRRTGAR